MQCHLHTHTVESERVHVPLKEAVPIQEFCNIKNSPVQNATADPLGKLRWALWVSTAQFWEQL
jgi:hypothetical protein